MRARAGERPALVAEELALEDGLGQGAAVDGHERLVGARALRVDGAGDELLARAALADDEDRGRRRRDVRDRLVDREHRRRRPDDLRDGRCARARGGWLQCRLRELAPRDGLARPCV